MKFKKSQILAKRLYCKQRGDPSLTGKATKLAEVCVELHDAEGHSLHETDAEII